jgi:hypothetical protein
MFVKINAKLKHAGALFKSSRPSKIVYIRWRYCKFCSYSYKENAELHLYFKLKLTFFLTEREQVVINLRRPLCATEIINFKARAVHNSISQAHTYIPKNAVFCMLENSKGGLAQSPSQMYEHTRL